MSRGPDGQGFQVLPPRVHPEPDTEDQDTPGRDQSLQGPGREYIQIDSSIILRKVSTRYFL